jgi:hypothetical protein
MNSIPLLSRSLVVVPLAAVFTVACGGTGIPVPGPKSTGGSSPSGGGGSGGGGGTAGSNTGGAAGQGGTGGSTAGTVALGACSALPKVPTVGLCVQPVGGWQDGASITGQRSVQLGGTISAVAKGPVTGGCFQSAGDATSEIVALTVQASTDAGATDWNVEYQVPANPVVWTVGEHIDVAYTRRGGGWSPEISSLTLNFGQAVDVYVGSGGVVTDLGDVPLTFRPGAAICLQHDTCGDWSGYDLEVKDTSGWTRVPYGTTTSIGGYRIVHGGVSEQLSSTTTCMDWYIADVQVAVLRVVN